MYPSTHLLAEALIDDRLREADHARRVKATQSSEIAPRWWRSRSWTTPESPAKAPRVAEPRPVALSRVETPTWT
jgi:hypothetical protein